MAEVYCVKITAEFLVLADDERDATTIASVLVDGINDDLPGDAIAELYAYPIFRQDGHMRRRCVNFEGHADNQEPDTSTEATAVSPETSHDKQPPVAADLATGRTLTAAVGADGGG